MIRPFLALLLIVTTALPVRAQVTADQLNKLSLEALTAPPPHAIGGYAHGGYHQASPRRRYAARPSARHDRSYAGSRRSAPSHYGATVRLATTRHDHRAVAAHRSGYATVRTIRHVTPPHRRGTHRYAAAEWHTRRY
jgi:hypothetical protein